MKVNRSLLLLKTTIVKQANEKLLNRHISILWDELFRPVTYRKRSFKISSDNFKWEVEDKIDSVASILHKQFVVVSSDGSISQKKAYIERLSGENFKHNAIDITENKVVISGNTATVIGKGKFDVTVSGNRRISQLSFLEVFTRESSKKPWKMLALKASAIN